MFRSIFTRLFAKKKPTLRQDLSRKLGLEPLENRNLMSVSSLSLSGSTLYINSNSSATNATVHLSGSNLVVSDLGTGQNWSYASSSVGMVEFRGGAGNDRFVNNAFSLPIRAFGYGGSDYLEGYNGNDYFDGGDGNDTLVGYGGNDTMFGGAGNDVLRGMSGADQLIGQDGDDRLDGGTGNDSLWGSAGNDTILGGSGDDQLIGGDGNDHLNGQQGYDRMWGGNGSDVIIAIDGAYTDFVQGDAGNDIMWVDRYGSSVDGVADATSGDVTQYVSSFANGADRTLDGDRITDPTAKSGQVYRRFANNPLFASNGPTASDVRQGNLGDCWLLAGLAGVANDRPAAIRERVVDFDDGTYGVRLGNSFYRVDDDLAVANSTSTSPVNASLGRENSMWVAAVEKAFAHYRTGANSFASLEGGWGIEVNQAFNSSNAGRRNIGSYSSAAALGNDIFNRWNNYQAVTIGFLSGSGAPLVTGHMYTVMSVSRNSSGVVTSVTLRNPWGFDGVANSSDPSDGLVTVTPAQLFGYTGQVNWGRV